MKAHELSVKTKRSPIRPGRGISAGRGKTAGRGTKGQNARSGGGTRPGFEGGQNPLMQRLPKQKGFTSKQRYKFENIYTKDLNQLKTSTKVTAQSLSDVGLVSTANVRVKVILKGDLDKKLTVELQAASQGAVDAISKAGGNFKQVDRIKAEAKLTKKS